MNIKKTAITSLLALAGVALLAPPANAATVSYTADDLFLGFRQSGNTTSDYLIDLGSAANYRDGLTTGVLSLGNINADLSLIFGTGWKSDPNVFWGIVGTPGSASVTLNGTKDWANTLYSSVAEAFPFPGTTAAAQANAPISQSSATQGNARSTIVSMAVNDYSGQTSTTNSSVAIIENPGGANSWGINAPNSFSYSPFGNIEGSFANTATGAALDLFRTTPSGLSNSSKDGYRGTFTIDNTTGAVSYNTTVPTAVPEPSTYATFGLGAVLLVMAIRRKRQSVHA